jgi:hypothetical protein
MLEMNHRVDVSLILVYLFFVSSGTTCCGFNHKPYSMQIWRHLYGKWMNTTDLRSNATAMAEVHTHFRRRETWLASNYSEISGSRTCAYRLLNPLS